MNAVVTLERSEAQATLTQGMRDRALVSLQEGRQAAEDIRAAAGAAGVGEMTMEEIDAIIAECRREWRQSEGQ